MLSNYSFRHTVRSWKLLVAFGIALVIVVLVYQPVKIEGNSMAPLLSDHELIFINRLVYHFEPVQRGDVVVFWYPLDRTKSFIKRIVALPGETVEIRQGLVYVNGNWLPEFYVPSRYEDLSNFGPLQVPSESISSWAITAAARMIQEFSVLLPTGRSMDERCLRTGL
jgi:signal peptidase I